MKMLDDSREVGGQSQRHVWDWQESLFLCIIYIQYQQQLQALLYQWLSSSLQIMNCMSTSWSRHCCATRGASSGNGEQDPKDAAQKALAA